MSKCCFVTWLLILASALWITGLTIGIIGAVNWAPLKPFLDNAKSSTCTLVEYEYQSSRCTKWGNCLIVTWEVTHPGLKDPNAVVTAWIIEKKGLGYNDASKLVATRNAGDVVSCWIDARTETSGYFNKPGGGYFAELVIGWLFFFIGTFIWIIFFMEVCCGIKIYKCSLRCCCRPGTSKSRSTATTNPLYGGSSSLYGNTTTTTTAARRTSMSSRSYSGSGSVSSSSPAPDAELTVIPPTTAIVPPPVYDSSSSSGSVSGTPTSESPMEGGGAGAGGLDQTSSSSSGDNYGAGAGVTN